MTALTFTVQQSGERLDAFWPAAWRADPLRRPAPAGGRGGDLPRESVEKNDRPAAGDVVEVLLPDPEPVDVLPQDIPLDVVYEDGDVIVVNSRWAWWSTPPRGTRTGRW